LLTEFKRVKHGEILGTLHRRHLIRMRERGDAFHILYSSAYWQEIDERQAKAFRRYLRDKSRKRQRRRDRETILIEISGLIDGH
jgi:hypothetical protein